MHRLDGAKGQQITSLGGVVWVTQANDNRDIILSKGQSFIIDRKGLTVVFAFKDVGDRRRPGRPHHGGRSSIPALLQGLAA